MARKIEVEILGDSRSLERAFLRSSKAGDGFARGISRASIVAGAALAAFAAGAVKGVQAASNLAEQTNKANVVFEQNASAIAAWADTTADAFGISERAALEAAGSFGQMLQTAGVLPKQSAEMSRALVELGSDLASFNNIDPTEALEKLRSGLAGEAEPLRRLGVFLSEARVQQEAYRLGIAETGEELTEAQKVQARYSLILQDTAKAQGDFARTSDSVANASRRVRAQLEDAAAGISAAVLPAVAGAADAMADFISDFSEAETIEAKFDVVISNATEIATEVSDQVTDAVGAIDWSRVFDRATGFAEGLQERVAGIDFGFVGEEIGNAFSDAARVALPAAKEMADRIGETVRAVDFDELGKELGPGLAQAVVTAIGVLLDPAFWVRNWDVALAVALTAFTGPIGRFAGRAAGLLVEGIASAVARFSPRLAQAFVGLALQTVRVFGAAIGQIGAVVSRALAPLTGLVGAVFRRLGRLATFTAKVLGITAIINTLTDLAAEVGDIFEGIGRSIAGFFDRAFDFVVRKALELVQDVLGVTEFLGRFDPFKGVREGVERRLAEMRADVGATTSSIQKDLDGLKGPKVNVEIGTVVTGGGPGAGAGGASEGAEQTGSKVAAQITKNIEGIVQAYRDAATKAIDRGKALIEDAKKKFPELIAAMELDLRRAGLTEGIADDLRELGRLEAAIREQMRIEGQTTDLIGQLMDVRERRTELLQREAEASSQRSADAFAGAVEASEFRMDEALEAGNFKRALSENAELQATIRKRIDEEGKTYDLLRQLDAAQDRAAEIRKEMRDRNRAQTQRDQFRALGLTGEGDRPTPGIENLRKQLGSLEQNVKGTILDTPKTQALFDRVRKVLAGGWGKATEETRAKIREFFEEIRGELNSQEKKGPLTPTVALDTSKITEGISGLTPDQIRELRGRLSAFNTGGVALAGGTVRGAGSTVNAPIAVGAQSFAFDLYIDGEPVAASVIPRAQKRSNRNPGTARGRFAGRSGI